MLEAVLVLKLELKFRGTLRKTDATKFGIHFEILYCTQNIILLVRVQTRFINEIF